MGDFNGDKNVDLLCKNSESGQGRTVALSDGSAGFKVRKCKFTTMKLLQFNRFRLVLQKITQSFQSKVS